MLTLLVLGLIVGVISLGPTTLRELFFGLTFVRPHATQVAPAATHADPGLQRGLDSVAASISRGRFSAAVVDLETGGTASVDAERAYPAASLFKVPILIEVLAEEAAGRLDPLRALEIKPDDWTDGSGVLQARVGERLSVRELTRLMIQESDNIAALVLLDAVGVANVNATADRLGLHATHLVDHRAGDQGEHTTSAADMARLLTLLTAGQVVDQRVSEATLAELELRQSVTWLGDGLPFWVKVAHKWGDLPQARNDVGVVFSPPPRGSYVLAVLSEGGQPDEVSAAIGRASRVTYDYLGARNVR
jgi:beta-lactamase class A